MTWQKEVRWVQWKGFVVRRVRGLGYQALCDRNPFFELRGGILGDGYGVEDKPSLAS